LKRGYKKREGVSLCIKLSCHQEGIFKEADNF